MNQRALNWIILILAVLAVPFTHGILQYCALIIAALYRGHSTLRLLGGGGDGRVQLSG
jgi:hypothetical protein